MTTAGVDPNLASNLLLLQKQSLKVEFHLDHTDYKKVENIGTGAYGVVCSAINKKTRQRVAIKKIPNLFTMDPRYAIRTYREIKILQHFKHSNIIAIREILQPANKDITDIYVVMDLMESDLHRIIYSKQALTDEHVKYFLYQMLRGLKYIHSAHVIHRDLKPSNLLVNADCELKIGDFGMARGINFKTEKSNQQMTQYVATRWYRAPELIVASRQGYGAAIDMWSVGCIFAEMLRRKHLFPGRDLLNQLTVIFGTLGIPSKQYLDLLDSDTVCAFIRKVTESGETKRKTYSELCPKASPEAIDLLSKLLVIEPEKRIDVEKALDHPFLAKYHDNTYEPDCSRTFDFTFEQELVDLHSDDQKRVKIQDLLKKEVFSYRKPKPMDFGALITTSKAADGTSQTMNSTDDNPYADLSAFLAQMASPDKETPSTTPSHSVLAMTNNRRSVNALLEAQKSTSISRTSLDQKSKNHLLESQDMNPLLDGVLTHTNPLLNAQVKPFDTQSNPLLAQANILPFQKSNTNPLLAGVSDAKPLMPKRETNPLLGKIEPNPLLTKVEAKTENVGEDCGVHSFTNQAVTIATTSESDQSNDTDLFNSFLKGHVKPELLSTTTAESLSVTTNVKPGGDDIEMISAKLEQTDINVEKPETQPENKALDAKSLLRQRLMDRKNSNTGVAKTNQLDKSTTGKAPITAYQRQKEREERRKKRKDTKLTKKKKKESDTGGHLLTSEDQKMLDRWTAMAKPQPIQPKPTLTTNTIVSTGGNNVIVVYPASVATTHTYISTDIFTSTRSSTSVLDTQIPTQQVTNQVHIIRDVGQQVAVNPIPGVSTFINSSNQGQRLPPSQPIRSFSDIAALHGHNDQYIDNGNDTSLYELNQFEQEPVYPNSSTSQESVYPNSNTSQAVTSTVGHQYSNHRNDQLAHWSNTMNMNTTLDIAGMVEHKQDDGLPPMLVSTPKGTGGGYGVGYDMEAMMAYNPDLQNVHMDSAPLSASLLADWMDVTSNMDPKALEDIQHELELSSALHDFPFNY